MNATERIDVLIDGKVEHVAQDWNSLSEAEYLKIINILDLISEMELSPLQIKALITEVLIHRDSGFLYSLRARIEGETKQEIDTSFNALIFEVLKLSDFIIAPIAVKQNSTSYQINYARTKLWGSVREVKLDARAILDQKQAEFNNNIQFIVDNFNKISREHLHYAIENIRSHFSQNVKQKTTVGGLVDEQKRINQIYDSQKKGLPFAQTFLAPPDDLMDISFSEWVLCSSAYESYVTHTQAQEIELAENSLDRLFAIMWRPKTMLFVEGLTPNDSRQTLHNLEKYIDVRADTWKNHRVAEPTAALTIRRGLLFWFQCVRAQIIALFPDVFEPSEGSEATNYAELCIRVAGSYDTEPLSKTSVVAVLQKMAIEIKDAKANKNKML